MEHYLTRNQAQFIDGYTQDQIGIPGLVLMERAAVRLAENVESIVGFGSYTKAEVKKETGKILAVAGSGNNGGDAIAAARILKAKGFDTYIYEVPGFSSKSESYMKQVEIARNAGVQFVQSIGRDEYDIILDGIFGIGLSRPVRGEQKDAIDEINESGAYVIGVDIPSGICSDTGHVLGAAVRCNVTITFEYIKVGMLFDEGREFSGMVVCEDIGLYHPNSRELFSVLSSVEDRYFYYEYEEDEIASHIPERTDNSNKGTYGKVLIVAGNADIYGAVYLAAEACYKTGAGLVKVVTDIRNRDTLTHELPEAMMLTYDEDAVTSDFEDEYLNSINWADVVLIGPGLGRGGHSRYLLETVIKNLSGDKSVIFDADAINLLAEGIIEEETVEETLGSLTSRIGSEHVIITPHIAEFSRLYSGLTGEKEDAVYIKENRAALATEVSEKLKLICILKDARTVVSCAGSITPDHKLIYVNTTGNSGMSKGGSGDVLAGVLAGLLAQNKNDAHTNYELSCVAVNLHGSAGDHALETVGERKMLARDIINSLA